MVRSLRVAPDYIQKVKSALQRNSYPNQQALAGDVGVYLSTVKNFLSGKPVDYLNFVEICEKLRIDWQAIAYKEPDNLTLKESSPFITGTPITHPRYFFGRHTQDRELHQGDF